MGLCKKLLIGDGITALITLILCLSLGLTVGSRNITSTFFSRCERFNEYDCHKVWDAFQQAYVNKDPCKVPVEAYDPLIAAAPFKPQCNKTMFWSKTKDVVHGLTAKRNDCFVTLEDTLLGSVLDNLTWCGKEGSNDTFTTGCPGWSECVNNPVRSFWNRSSAAFADVACGNVTAMLNGSINTPFNPTSNFASVEVPRFKAPRVKKLNVVMVIQKNAISNCNHSSLKELEANMTKRSITYTCKDVSESQIQECGSKPEIACGACW